MRLTRHPNTAFQRIKYQGKLRTWIKWAPFLTEILRLSIILGVMVVCTAICVVVGKLLVQLPSLVVMALYLVLLGLSGFACTKVPFFKKALLRCPECNDFMNRRYHEIQGRDVIFYECRCCSKYVSTGTRR